MIFKKIQNTLIFSKKINTEAKYIMREFVWNIAQSLSQPNVATTPVKRTIARRQSTGAKR